MIKIRLRDLEKIFHRCREELPIEACGVLAGKIKDDKGVTEKEVTRAYNCKNELNSPTEYKIVVKELFQILSEINNMGLRLLGFYHSHVTHPYIYSRPSSVDKERANYIGYSYLIVTLNPERASSWILEEKGLFTEEEITTF